MRAEALLLLLACVWPLREWWLGYLRQGGDESWLLGLPPVLLALSLRGRPRSGDLRLCGALLIVQALLAPWLLDLPRAVLAALAFASFLTVAREGKPWSPSLAGLLILALPALETAQFYLGYPLRRGLTMAAEAALSLQGMAVKSSGCQLLWRDQVVCVDAPCSGLKMLWAGYALLFLLGFQRRWPWPILARWIPLTGLLLLAANLWRATSLFYLTIWQGPSWMHELVGLLCFAAAAAALVHFSPSASAAEPPPRPAARGRALFWLGALLCLAAPRGGLSSAASATLAPPAPQTFEGLPLRELPQDPQEKLFYARFPGWMKRFSDGHRQIVVRYLTEKTRRLHSTAECLRGCGYRIEREGIEGDAQGRLWRTFLAVGPQRWRVRERIYSHADPSQSWTDPSQWYWSDDMGPWWAVSVAEASR